MKTGIMLILLLFTLAFFSCSTEPPDIEPIIILTAEDVSSTEVWLRLSLSGFNSNTNFVVTRNNTPILNLTSPDKDTVLFDENLLPNQSYTYKVSAIFNKEFITAETTAKTLDTTSHNFTWQTFTFGGDAGSCILRDVAIINENNIWAVGDIKIADTSANGYTTYNAIHWNGNEWELKRITVNFRGFLITPTIEGIFAISPTKIWLAGGLTIFGDGTNWTPYDIRMITGIDGLSASKIWGSSPDNMYFVGRNGNITHYNGSQWTKIESGTNLNINDIWGDYDEKNNEWEILAVGGDILHGTESERVILKIRNNQAEQLNAAGANWPLRTIWFKTSKKYFAAGSGIYEKHNINQNSWENDVYDISAYSINRLRGELLNNIAATGGVGELLHFNGLTWQSYIDETMLNSGNFYGLSIKGNLIVAVGQNNPSAVITIGRK